MIWHVEGPFAAVNTRNGRCWKVVRGDGKTLCYPPNNLDPDDQEGIARQIAQALNVIHAHRSEVAEESR